MTPFYDQDGITLYHGDCREVLPRLRGFRAVVTSPPYWSLRVYTEADDVGAEQTPEEYVAQMAGVMSLCREGLADDGSMWLNVGDSYAASGKGGGGSAGTRACWSKLVTRTGFRMPPPGYKMKDLTLTPFMLADRLRRDGWYLRQTVIWQKAGAVEPIRADRPATSHEYVFQLSKQEMYYAPKESPGRWWGHSVWQIPIEGYGGHPAVMPIELAKRCILAATEPGDVVVDPFGGAGTTLRAAKELGRRAVGVEIDRANCEIIAGRLAQGVLFGAA